MSLSCLTVVGYFRFHGLSHFLPMWRDTLHGRIFQHKLIAPSYDLMFLFKAAKSFCMGQCIVA